MCDFSYKLAILCSTIRSGMIKPTETQINEYSSLFNSDISAAHNALGVYNPSMHNNKTVVIKKSNYELNEIIISLKQVSKSYFIDKRNIKPLDDVTLNIHKGEFVAITGASGSGKSTLLQIIGCLDKPTDGTVTVKGQETTKLNDASLSKLRKESLGFIFQSFYLQPFLKLGDNIAVPAMFTNVNRRDIDSKVALLLQRVGLSDRINHFPKELSGGQIQRAAIARALINNPSIILADEPTGNLDSTNSESIIELFHTIRDTLGTTIVVVTHDTWIASRADRIIELKDGAIV